MLIAREGFKEIILSTMVLAGLSYGASLLHPLASIPFVVVWIWVLAFFRDPPRNRTFESGELCSPADGTITEITELDHYDAIGGPAIRIGMFLSLFNVHINRSSCAGTVKSVNYFPGEFLDARHPESGRRNEQNVVLIETDAPIPGPVEIRQIAGLVARRIICHAKVGDQLTIGERFGLIKFGSRTELIIPRQDGTEVVVSVGDKVSAGLTVLARQKVTSPVDTPAVGCS